MSYVVLARKYRPQSFEDLVGQSHVSQTIGNAIAQNRVAHAFLFTGVRGVGKTTSARILAKALNCEKGPTAQPCQVCPQCVEITAGSDVDVQEIDGASYNGIDEVRRLQESLPYRPARDRFKIFIVDEVHMLSNAAWNAFLKTLEEPPPHVKFIFATTEVHKVPVTILSRCQRYDFKMLSAQTIAARLRHVLELEKVPADDTAISAIAREAAGSMRDAMSLLDQVIAAIGAGSAGGAASEGGARDKLTAELVAKVLGVADRMVMHRLAGALVDGDAGECLRVVGELAQEGYDLPHVARDFLSHLRDLVVAKVCADPAGLLDLAEEEIGDVKALAERASADDLARLHQGFSRSFDDIVRGGQPRASLEMTLVRLARRPALLPVDELLRKIGELERRLAGAGGPSGGGGGGGGGGFGGSAGGGGGAPHRGGEGRSMSAGSAGSAGPVAPQAAPRMPAGGAALGDPSSVVGVPARPEAFGREPHGGGAARPSATAGAEGPPDSPPAISSAGPPVSEVLPSSLPASNPMGLAASPPGAAIAGPAHSGPAHSGPVPSGPAFSGPAPSGPAPSGAPGPTSSRALPPQPSPLNFAAMPATSPPPRPTAPPAASSPPARPVAPPTRGMGPGGMSSSPAPDARSYATSPDARYGGGSSGGAPSLVSADGFASWRSIIDNLRSQNARIASFYDHAVPLHIDSERIVVGFDADYMFAETAMDVQARDLLLGAARRHFGRAPSIAFERTASRSGTIAQAESAEKRARTEAAKRSIAEHPLVTAAIELLGAELKDVRLSQELAES